ncbi:PPE family protein [Mycobacterium sp. Marseille-P9652]|uniref:PPE family protein n=1 Tax=Mycobacterium sp. Marseille-P9652 TaxID=2654950 RepID=UPI0018D0ACDA|nr:PPE family protein [Mycobacterium sp. Marseille-P9652]
MTAELDFALFPPEINSARIYSGPGSGPMLAAAAAWKGLAAELRATALSYHAVLSALTGEEWRGPAAASMAAAATPYVAWMDTTAARAEQTATQAEAAAAAFDAAFTATVPPPVIAANRAQLMALIATNILGQNTPAIAATEAQYAEMWAQDAAAMYGYAASSAVATRLTPFSEPGQNTNPVGLLAQSAAVGQAAATPAGTQQATLTQLMSGLTATLQGLSSPVPGAQGALVSAGWDPFAAGSATDTTGLDGVLNLFGSNTAFGQFVNANLWNTVFSSGFYMPSNTMAPFLQLAGQQSAGQAVGDAAAGDAAGQAAGAAGGAAPASGGLPGQAAAAGMGRAPMVGPLSVPPSWTTAPVPSASPLAPTLGGTPMIAPPAMAAGMPGIPPGGAGGQGYGRATPQYGFRPTFVARPPAAG